MQTEDWFDVGWAMFAGGARGDARMPSLNDMEAQRYWLGGFGAAWAVSGCPESVDVALVAALSGHEELLRQLRCHRAG